MKNDAKDAESIARLAKFQEVKYSLIPEPQILALRMMSREYYAMSDMLTEMKNRLCTDLYLLFPGYINVFGNPFGKASLELLKRYPSPRSLSEADSNELAMMISKISRKTVSWAMKKVETLLEITAHALAMPMEFDILSLKIKAHVENIESFQDRLDGILKQLKTMIQSSDFPAKERRYIELLEEMPGIGFLTAVTLIAEIGDFSKFHSPKAFVAFFGIDPSVNDSGKFRGDRNKISKRGTRFGRRVLFTAALASIRTTRKGDAINPILRDYYHKKCENKKKKVALVAVMHKLLNYIFAVLRDEKPFALRSPEDHQTWRHDKESPLKLVA